MHQLQLPPDGNDLTIEAHPLEQAAGMNLFSAFEEIRY